MTDPTTTIREWVGISVPCRECGGSGYSERKHLLHWLDVCRACYGNKIVLGWKEVSDEH
jgi:formylmethanofuran dehydrogenase subunit E